MTLRSTQIRKTEHRTRLKNSIDVSQILKVVIRYHSHLKDLSNCVKPAHQIWGVCSRTGAKCQMVPNPRTATEFCFSELVQALRLHAQRVTTSYERVRTTIRHAISDVLIDFTFTLCKNPPFVPTEIEPYGRLERGSQDQGRFVLLLPEICMSWRTGTMNALCLYICTCNRKLLLSCPRDMMFATTPIQCHGFVPNLTTTSTA